MYVCKQCGRELCGSCFDPYSWVCVNCYGRIKLKQPSMPTGPVYEGAAWPLAHKLFLLSFLVIFVGMALVMAASILNFANISGGVIFLIGPIPIILGAGQNWLGAIAIAAILTVFAILFFLLFLRKESR